jgi:RNA polymerase sigma factor for flagellar operon FliA
VSVVALDELLSVGSERGDRLSLVDTLEDKDAEDPGAVFESQEMKGILAGAISRLGERERIVIARYDEGLPLAEIGQVLGVTESRVCQMHTKAVLQLRAKMQDARQLRGPRAPAEAPAGDPGGCPQSRQRPPPAGAAG